MELPPFYLYKSGYGLVLQESGRTANIPIFKSDIGLSIKDIPRNAFYIQLTFTNGKDEIKFEVTILDSSHIKGAGIQALDTGNGLGVFSELNDERYLDISVPYFPAGSSYIQSNKTYFINYKISAHP